MAGTPVVITNYNELAHEHVDYELNKKRENYKKWGEKFKSAESARRSQEDQWREFYKQVYEEENSWWKNLILFALNGIQLWALAEQYKQQKEIADRTYDIANRQQAIAEEMYNIYKSVYQPQESATAGQLSSYFGNPYRQQYSTTAGRFAVNARAKVTGKRREVLMCASQYCTGAVKTSLRDIAAYEANIVGNAMNSAIKYENLREQRMEDRWLQARLAFIQTGRGLSGQTITGIGNAARAFSSFGADPGAALNQLLGVASYTIGGLISSPSSRSNAAPIVEARPAYSRGASTTPRTVSSVVKG